MGLFDSLKSIVSKSPVVALTSSIISGLKGEKEKQKAQVATTIKSSVALVAGVATLGTSAGRAAVSTVAKALVPKTTKGVVTAAIAAPVAVGVLTSSPKARETVVSAPSSLTSFGSSLGGFIEEPTVSKAKEVVMDNPLASGLVGAGIVAATAGIAVPVISGALTRESIQDVEEAIKSQKPVVMFEPTPLIDTAPIVSATPAVIPDQAMTSINESIPILPEDKVKTKRRTYKRRKPVPQVRITNRNINKLVAVVR